MTETDMQHGCDWAGQCLAGYCLTEKFDGCRAYFDGRSLWSRGGISIDLPDAWRAELPDMHLDCELYDGIGGVYRCGTAIKYGRFTPSMRLVVFDAPLVDGGYAERMAVTRHALDECACTVVADLRVAHSTQDAFMQMHQIQQRGGEGVMAINPVVVYSARRTHNLLKIKVASACR